MPFIGKVGDTFFRNDSGDGHSYVILTPPNKNGKVVVVNFTEATYYLECFVTFSRRDDHRLFSKKTTVNYGRAMFIDQKTTRKYISRNPKLIRPYCQPHILKKVIKGAFLSKSLHEKFITELRKYYPEDYDTYYSEDE